jgi:hypothetical protein
MIPQRYHYAAFGAYTTAAIAFATVIEPTTEQLIWGVLISPVLWSWWRMMERRHETPNPSRPESVK